MPPSLSPALHTISRGATTAHNKFVALLLTLAAVGYPQVLTNTIHKKLGLIIFILCNVTVLIISQRSFYSSLTKSHFLFSTFIIGALISALGNTTAEMFTHYKGLGYLLLAILAWTSANERSKISFIDYMSVAAIAAILCIALGSVYAYHADSPVFYVENPDGRQNYWYLTTFSGNILQA